MSAIIIPPDFISAAAVIIALISLLLKQTQKSTTDAKKLEERLAKLEQNQITPEERKCIIENTVWVKLMANVIEKDFSKILREPTTPELDVLIDKVGLTGFQSLTGEELTDLIKGLDAEFDKAVTSKKDIRAAMLSFYRSAAKLRQIGFDDACTQIAEKIVANPELIAPKKKQR